MTDYSIYVARFKAFLVSQSKSNYTVKQYSLDSAQFVKFMKEQNCEMLMVETIQAYKEWLQQHYSSIQSVNRKLASLKSFIHFLQAREVIPLLPDDLFSPIAIEKNELKTLSIGQMRQALHIWLISYEAAEEQDIRWMALRNYTIMRVIAELGIKSSEVVRMKWSHVHQDVIRILSKRSYRDLPLPQALLDVLQFYKEETMKQFTVAQEVDDIWLGLGNKQGEPITVKTIERLFSYVSQQVGFSVTTTNVRYTAIQQDLDKELHATEDLYEKYGYARKGVLQERATRMEKSE
ncbi:tyrosine-type recombinase/integrase [Metasolibacillus meyeri]|uniref:tyrosine-type recombinase/integrase n=1 Tax=Metasolibacillus meyeri TaxID=1071052 RepID=UPI000D31F747|nr:site-specific integrase [Metasolibacillus meyeri]